MFFFKQKSTAEIAMFVACVNESVRTLYSSHWYEKVKVATDATKVREFLLNLTWKSKQWHNMYSPYAL